MFNDVYRGRRVLVTGNTGFKGSWLTMWLLQLGADVVGVSRDVPTEPAMFELLGLENSIEHHWADVTDPGAILRIIGEAKADFIFHMAAQPIVAESYKNPLETMATNALGTASVLDAMRVINRTCTAVMITSDKCYENVEWTWGYRENDRLGGKDPYSASKGCAELIIHSYFHSFFSDESSNVRLASSRAGNVIGGGDWAANRVIPDTVRAWAEGEPVRIRQPRSTRPWQHVLEPLSGYLHLGERLHQDRSISGEAYNFGPAADQVFTVEQCIREMAKNWRIDDPDEQLQTTGNDLQFHEAGLLKLNCDKSLHHLGWKPTLGFHDAISFTGDWYHAYYRGPNSDMRSVTMDQINNYVAAGKAAGAIWTI